MKFMKTLEFIGKLSLWESFTCKSGNIPAKLRDKQQNYSTVNLCWKNAQNLLSDQFLKLHQGYYHKHCESVVKLCKKTNFCALREK